MNIGERVGDYEIVAILGAGGMGQVYKVRSVISDRVEAMKVLLPNLSSDTALADRFLREIKVQATLDHPNIARMNSAQQVGNQLIMLMEYVEGKTIYQILHQGPMELSESLNCASQVLDALAYAHALAVVHRDIKPPNIMRTPSGVIKLMDFGIARMGADRQLTKTGAAVGSLYYMSPEQINGGPPDLRSDLYSLGVTLYEMVTGKRPFVGDSDYSIMAAHLQNRPVAPMEIIATVPRDLNDIILMAIDKEPERRFQSADAFHAALRNFAGSIGVTLGASKTAPTPVLQAPRQSAPMGSTGERLAVTATSLGAPPTARPAAVQAPAPPVFQAPPGPAPVPQAPLGPPPVLNAQSAPPYPKSGSRRGLYMALGSVATLLVLAAAIIEGPKLLHSSASTATPQTAQPVENKPVDSTAAPAKPSSQPAAQPDPAPPAQTPPAQAPVDPPATPAPPQASQTKTTAPSRTSQRSVQPPPSALPAAAQAPASQQQPPARPTAAELNELRQQYNQVAIRVGAAKSGLRALQQQMQRQGVDLRGDMLEAESRMDYLMKESMDSMRSGDADSSRTSLQMAERSLETIEKFLGR